jgi:hypothetical protein
MSLNVLSRTEILDIDRFTSSSTHYSYKRKLQNYLETFNKMSHLSCMWSEFTACNKFSFHGRHNNRSLLIASLGYKPFNNKKICPEIYFLLSTHSTKFKSI